MIGLNSLVAVVLEVGSKCCPEVVGRAYADDLSATMVTTSADRLLNGLRHFNRIVQALANSGFGEILRRRHIPSVTRSWHKLSILDTNIAQHYDWSEPP